MQTNRIEEWIALWIIIALVNRQTTQERILQIANHAAKSAEN